ncbi:MAG: hypothetical protein ACI97P_000676 [Arcticibacterium sp.]|jgi:uncharacterized protein YyaL (SSP411 family)
MFSLKKLSKLNRLKDESSPYLKQHKENPVDWYPWGPEALEKAKREDKVILVSIGYSACHWCHVMAHESFENEQIGALMSKYFINIKIDREERPDVDAIYMDALHAMGLRGGWPLNVFLMPDAKPFYGGTYFQPKQWQNLVLGIQNAFENEREKLESSAAGFANSLNTKVSDQIASFDKEGNVSLAWTKTEIELLYQRFDGQFDKERGGMQRAPKFPMPNIWHFLLRAQTQYQNSEVLSQIRLTLDRVALGGIYDHVGGGWTRYSTDGDWKVPHFEKMLYDNGQLLELYAEAYLYFKRNSIYPESQRLYKWAADKTISWLETEMQQGDGAFFSALDADSEGVEGKYYTWTVEETGSLLGKDAKTFNDLYGFSSLGNWEHGQNILHLECIPGSNEWPVLQRSWDKLAKVAQTRTKPGLDDKLICSWNGLMLSGLVKAYEAFGDKKVLELAKRNANYFKVNFTVAVETVDGDKATGLWHVKNISGFLDDYAAYIKALCELYQVTFEEEWLQIAESLAKYVKANFYDSEEGLFYYTDIQSEKLIARKKEIYDNVIPASNSMLAYSFIDLGHLLSEDDLIELGNSMFTKIKDMIGTDPSYLSNWASVGLKLDTHVIEVAILGENALEVLIELKEKVNQSVYYAGSRGNSELPILKDRSRDDGQTYIYVCQNRTCQLPTTSVLKALEMIHGI